MLPGPPTTSSRDADGTRYRASYFDRYPGIWRQRDWIKFTERGSSVIVGRSDATLNRGGVRLGTGEFYAVVEELAEIVTRSSRWPDNGPAWIPGDRLRRHRVTRELYFRRT
jgi:acyl-coenzyme A synthetase/AMP-(fatty) acid ligase